MLKYPNNYGRPKASSDSISKVMLGKGPIGIMQRIVKERHNVVHFVSYATCQTKAFLVT